MKKEVLISEEQPPVFNLDRVHELLTVYKIPLIFSFLALMLLGGGLLAWQSFHKTDNVIFDDALIPEASSSATLRADLEGAVMKPGIYELPFGSRLSDLLIKAGGMSAEADRPWIEKNLNLAQKVVDGGKIYIPRTGEISNLGNLSDSSKTIKVNTASLSELDSLPGIGAATAQKIIDNRPYQSLEELVSRKLISKSVFEKIKEKISL